MSELYQGSADRGANITSVGSDAARTETVPEAYANDADLQGENYSHYSDADIETILASEDELPSRAESRARTWGDNPEYLDEPYLDAEYYADLDAFLAEEDELPSRAESRARTWGDNPEFTDETDLDPEYDTEQPGPGVVPGAPTADGGVQQGDELSADPNPSRDALDIESEDPAREPERPPPDVKGRVGELEAVNAELSKRISDLQARCERLEHSGKPEPESGVLARERDTSQWSGIKENDGNPRRWSVPSNEALAFGATAAGGVITTIAGYVPYLHADLAGMVANAVAIGATGVAWMRSRKEEKHGHRPEN
jgi:hypothetical protein